MISSTILFVDKLPFLQKFPPHDFEHFFCVCEEKKVIEQFLLFYFWYGSIDKSYFVIGRIVGVWEGGILGQRNHEPHTGFSYFR